MAKRILEEGKIPIMLIRRSREENFTSNLDRFEKSGWMLYAGEDCMNFIKKNTGFSLDIWIQKNVHFWKDLKMYHECMRKLNLKDTDFDF